MLYPQFKWMSLEELENEKTRTQKMIDHGNSIKTNKKDCNYVEGLSERMRWIDLYIKKRSPVEMSLVEIEKKLGHKVILINNKTKDEGL